ncbi:transposase [Paraburkholderia strydomiana]|uniref:transposase n=1 Tax=Paraburkholderia strydomiana TaxID=1245417 RepID=UPI0038B8A610
MLPAAAMQKTCGRSAANSRAVLEAILWGQRWMYPPTHFPPQRTCYAKYLSWKRSGMLDQVRTLLAHQRAGSPCSPALGSADHHRETV